MRVSFDFIIGEPHPISDADFDDIWAAMETAADSVGLELTGAVWDAVPDGVWNGDRAPDE